jgi:ABC-2 type transport system permease protein
LGGATTSIFQGILILFLGYFLGFRLDSWAMLPLVLVAMFVVSLLFSLLGTLLATKFDDMHSFPSVMNLLMMPMMFMSSAFFSSESYPIVLQWVVKFNPFDYCVQLLRYTMSGIETNLFLAVFIVGILIVLLGILGTLAFEKIQA